MADQCTFPADIAAIFGQLGTQAKTHVRVRGNHHGMALAKDEPAGRTIASAHLEEWLRAHF
ncbi:hypothetical protein [Achromobacter insolitus]|uniref:hypothetical protein n=1 Tax=Achromobacter insolitus TaxID=217204 RepID=UPI001FC9CAD4|nr:hypothetical protein [Achromobacter insolitus]